jgi:serine/threonine-protein kinase
VTSRCPTDNEIAEHALDTAHPPSLARHLEECQACAAAFAAAATLHVPETRPAADRASTADLLAREILRAGGAELAALPVAGEPAAGARAGETVDGKYRLARLLGRGGMGEVYEAEHLGTGRCVAVKLVHAKARAPRGAAELRFRREASAAGAIESPHVVAVLDAGRDEASGDLYLGMERLRGEDLQRLLRREGALRPDVALRIAAQALRGLAKAHEAGVVHRDVKPANLFLARTGEGAVTVKLLDFGIAKVRPEGGYTGGLTATGDVLGSPLYMSPEQMRGSRDVDGRADLWSLGSVLYCALTGRAPYQHVEDALDLALAFSSGDAPPPVRALAPSAPPEAEAIVTRALALDPALRWPTAAAMLSAVEALLPDGAALREPMLAGTSRGG